MAEKPIRIAHIMGKWVGGGVEAVVMNYYRNINRNKIQFDFICDNDSTEIPYDEIESLGGKVILIPPYQKVFKYQKILKKILKENNYKIVHSHINTLSVFSLLAAKRAGVSVRIAHSHSTTNKKEIKRNLLKQMLRPFSRMFSTDYFACSEYAGKWLFGNNICTNKNFYILYNAIEFDNFKYDSIVRKDIRNQLGYNEKDIIIGHVGRFVATKNQTFILDVFKKVSKENKNLKLLLVGQGPMQEEIKKKTIEYGLEPKVKFLGQRNDINKLYQAMDLLVFPSLYEGLGLVLIEAQCSNLPCIVSDKVPKAVKMNNNLVFLSLDESKWSKKVLEYAKIDKKIRNSQIEMNSKYNIVECSKQLEKKYMALYIKGLEK